MSMYTGRCSSLRNRSASGRIIFGVLHSLSRLTLDLDRNGLFWTAPPGPNVRNKMAFAFPERGVTTTIAGEGKAAVESSCRRVQHFELSLGMSLGKCHPRLKN